jgi:hypothetical protein
LHGPEETAVELSTAAMSEQGKWEAGKSRLGRARKGKRGSGAASQQLHGGGGDGRRSGGV